MSRWLRWLLVVLTALAWATCGRRTEAQSQDFRGVTEASVKARFANEAHSMLNRFCVRCHNEKERESGVRVDQLDDSLRDESLGLWSAIRKQVEADAMPPKEELQLSAAEKSNLLNWIDDALHIARSRDVARNGSMRRLTVAQYQNTLRDLLGIEEKLTSILPPDAVSKDGFTNNAQTMLLSPLQIEAYLQIAERALDLAIVDQSQQPTIQAFQVRLGNSINPQPCPDTLILGANNHLLANDDFIISETPPEKTFAFKPFGMQRKFRFIEGYQGNDTVRGWREFDSIYHAVFACMRGSEGYPKGRAYETIPDGLLLRPAIPSREIFGESNTYGPHANFKLSLRELPDTGRFRVTVSAAKFNDGLMLDQKHETLPEQSTITAQLDAHFEEAQRIRLSEEGIYQVDVNLSAVKPDPKQVVEQGGEKKKANKNKNRSKDKDDFTLQLGERSFTGRVTQVPFLAVRLPAGELRVATNVNVDREVERIVFRKVDPAHPLAKTFQTFERRNPELGLFMGLRRDCGSTLNRVGTSRSVDSYQFSDFVFEDALSNYPTPDVEKNNVNYLAGIREIGIRHEYTDGRDIPRLLIQQISFEGPYFPNWPPETHIRIFPNRDQDTSDADYAEAVIVRFAERAYRRPLPVDERRELMQLWRQSMSEHGNLQQSIRESLVAILTSPQFLFLIEKSMGPEAEQLDEWELASKLSYFLWNQPPDDQLRSLAGEGRLRQRLDAEVDRLIDDERFQQFTTEFVSQWLGLEKLAIVETDSKRYPRLTRDTKVELQKEPCEFFQHLVRRNEPVSYLVRSPYILANDVVASYYDCGELSETGLQFRPIEIARRDLGGVLTQAGILAGLSDGRESNPVKRGAWFARRMIATPPDDPPPNVPKLEDLTQLTIRQRLERHRDVKGCSQCHRGIDPWGMPFEAFDAAGIYKQAGVDASSRLPDETDVADFESFRETLANRYLNQIAFSTVKHLSIYAIGRSLTYNENLKLREEIQKSDARNLRLRDVIHRIVKSDLFMKK